MVNGAWRWSQFAGRSVMEETERQATGSPSNSVGFSTGYITIKDMVVTGMPIKIVGVAALTVLLPTLGVALFGMDQKV
ncbi:tonoplast dicarboxylate transporter-like [Hordeum vulgare]|uniref:tonoplast dicarboxylate transporter-like n=1 Tax=Hordeum vulgare subsp. vulgare TaxID=112509 RepID=UPI001D1A44D7|nr:tonoplast dicarboxylate transporter-like [Hordeum vulgare subsp. vulgare]KAE8787441.1 tonoplast dicarboxylate transporter-like [Hordeum vulgare]